MTLSLKPDVQHVQNKVPSSIIATSKLSRHVNILKNTGTED